MQIKIANHVIKITPRLKDRIEQRLGLALGRYADRIGSVGVKFVVVKRKGKPPVTSCQVDVVLCKRVTAQVADADLFASVDRAVDNATRRVAMAIELEDAAGTQAS
ncbi:MAG: HPF/RaiA family ribosome-associated protein [Planctomycetes bacterium]|nr:HPF/RaiA family ribosome-associated protein [Planctomycetota bacterium]